MKTFIQKLATIGVSEFVILLVLLIFLYGAVAMASRDVTFQLSILPPKPPTITTLLGDARTHSVILVGESEHPVSLVSIYNLTNPSVVTTMTDSEGKFVVSYNATSLNPGFQEFSATAVVQGTFVTDPSPRVAVVVHDDFSISTPADRAQTDVYFANADETTSQILSTIRANQVTPVAIPSSDTPPEGAKSRRALFLQLALFLIVFVETTILLLQRARRKQLEGKQFFHLGRGVYPVPAKHQS